MLENRVIGIVAGVLALSAIIPYTISIFRRKTVPNRATWFIWALCGGLIAGSYDAVGATDSRWVPWAYAVGPFLVFLLSIRYGEGGWTLSDKVCLAGVLLSVAIWVGFKTPLVVLLMNLFMDFMGLIPTLRKSWCKPETEDRLAWTISVVANTINLFAVEEWTFAIATFPVYTVIGCSAVTFTLYFRRKKPEAQPPA